MKLTNIVITAFSLVIASCEDQGTAIAVAPVAEPQVVWQQTNMPSQSPVQAILALSSTHVFSATYGSAILQSTDNGMSWTQSCSGISPTEDILCLVVTVDSFLFAGSGGIGIYRSNDLGKTWSKMSNPTGIVWDLFPCSSGQLVAGIFYAGVGRTTDNGDTWTTSTSGLDDRVLAVAMTSGGHLLAGTNSGLFRSTDDGSSWVRDAGIPRWFVHAIKITSNGYVFAGCGRGVYRSTDEGNTWTSTNLPSDLPAFCEAVNSNDRLYVGTLGGGVFLSTDYGNTWIPLEDGLIDKDIRSIAVSPEGYVFAGTYNSGVFRTTAPVLR